MILAPSPRAYARAAEALRAGEVVAHPTETVYGLAVDPFSEDAIKRLFEVKGRPESNPVLVIVASMAQLAPLVREVPRPARVLMKRFWPGPLSLVLPCAPGVPDALTAGTGTICIRCTENPVARGLCAAFGGGVTSTSANRSGEPPALDAGGALLPGVALALDGGMLAPSLPSTIYDVSRGTLLRKGPVGEAEILAALR